MSVPPGRPCFPHIHLKGRLPHALYADTMYDISTTCTNEMDMWDNLDTEGWGNTLPVIQLQVLHPHIHAVATPTIEGAAASPSPTSSPAPQSSPVAASFSSSSSSPAPVGPSIGAPVPPSLRLSNAAVRLAADCKPLLSRAGKGALKFSLTPSPVILARNLSSYGPTTPLTHPFYLHLSIPGPLGSKILPAVSGPHQLFVAPPKGKAGAGNAIDKGSNYIMGEHGVHHAFFVPLDLTPPARGSGGVAKLPSVYSLPANNNAPPAFVRFKEILGVNLGGRIWDCGLLLFEYLREVILQRDPHYFHGKKIFEVGSGTGIVGIWLWAYVLLKNRQAIAAAEKTGAKKPQLKQTTFLLTDQEEAMDNLRDNIATNLDLLAGGQSDLPNEMVRMESSRLGWGDDEDHKNLAIQPSATEPYDLILASDVVFNPIYFLPLLKSLDYISGPRTTILMAYRPRASDKRQDEVFFRTAKEEYGWNCRKEGKYQDVFMLTLERIPKEEKATQQSQTQASDSSATSPSPSSASSQPVADDKASVAAPPSASDPTPPAVAAISTPSPSPSSDQSSVARSPTNDDLLDAVLSLHELDLTSGHAEGRDAAFKQAEADGFAAGVKRGEGVAGEMGFYLGFLRSLSLLKASNPTLYNDRVWSKIAKLESSFYSSPLYKSGFDPAQMEDGSLVLQIRNGFKTLMTQMGVWQYFQQQESQSQQMSF